MKTMLTLLLGGFISISAFGQKDRLKTISLNVELYVHDRIKVKTELETFLEKNQVIPDLMNEINNQVISHFVLTDNSYDDFLDKMNSWGAINSRKMESVNYAEKLAKVNLEIERLETAKSEYEALLNQVDIKSENHVRYWEKLEETKKELRRQIELRDRYQDSDKKFTVKLVIVEENFLTNEPDFSFVNMPGLQYSFFIPNNQVAGLYPESMNGYSLKYLLNRRKTYLELGLFRSNQPDQNFSFDELYKFSLGQDFYSTHLGRGMRTFFNLYSGFNLGVFILTGEDENLISWQATPSLGLEIYKNKYLLWDAKAGYFLPFKENRNMRGLLFESSFNVVF